MFHSTWGHVITDNIRRLWFLKSDDFKTYFKNCPLVYLLCTKRGIFDIKSYQNFRRLLEILEIDVDSLQLIEQPTQFDKIILPGESFFVDTDHIRKFTAEYCETIDRVRHFALKNRTPTSSKKIYYFHGRRQIGEERLAEYFYSKGYAIIRPENLSLDEQLDLLINANSFASTLGSSSHNSIFLRNGTEAVFIPRNLHSLNNGVYQWSLNQINSINVTYIDSTLTLFSFLYSSNTFYIISRQLKQFFGDKFYSYEEADFKLFLRYIKKFMSAGRTVHNCAMNYYAPILKDFTEQLKQREDLIEAFDMPPGWEKFRPLLTYQTHVATRGWRDGWHNENQISNPIEKLRDIQAIKINFPNHKIYYSVYYDEAEGWSAEVQAPEQAGITSKRKSIFGIKIRLDEAGTKEFDILYRMHKFDDTWTPWAKNGETLYSYGVKLNAIQIKLEPKRT